MKLYYASHTRSIRPRWLLEELGVPFELARLNLKNQEHKSPEYLHVHPMGQVPALEDGNLRLFESAAICLYLADKHLDKGFAPPVGTADRALYYQWAFFAATDLEPPVLETYNKARGGGANEDETIVESRRRRAEKAFSVLDTAVTDREFLLGDRLTVPDVLVGTILDIARAARMLGEGTALAQYHQRLRDRPAYKKARADQ